MVIDNKDKINQDCYETYMDDTKMLEGDGYKQI